MFRCIGRLSLLPVKYVNSSFTVNTFATDAPPTARFDEKKIAQTCGSSRPAILINGNASLQMHCSEKSDNEIAENVVSYIFFWRRGKRARVFRQWKPRLYNYEWYIDKFIIKTEIYVVFIKRIIAYLKPKYTVSRCLVAKSRYISGTCRYACDRNWNVRVLSFWLVDETLR